MPIELRLLRCALAVAEHHNFVRAARAVRMSQPSLSRNIQNIEQRVGARLFERGTGDVVPTDAGEIFLKQAREVAARSADLDREMDLLKGLAKGELNIGSGTYPSAMMVDQAIVRLVRAHPTVQLRIWNDNATNLLPLVRKRELDLAVVGLNEFRVENEPGLHITRLNQHQGYFVVRAKHPLLASNREPTLRSILRFPVITASRISGPILKQFLLGGRRESPDDSAANPFPAITCDSVAMMKKITAKTDAVGLFPLNTITAEVRGGQLVVFSLALPFPKITWAIVRLSHRTLSPLGETFVHLLLDTDAELLDFEQKNAPKVLVASTRARSNPSSASNAG